MGLTENFKSWTFLILKQPVSSIFLSSVFFPYLKKRIYALIFDGGIYGMYIFLRILEFEKLVLFVEVTVWVEM